MRSVFGRRDALGSRHGRGVWAVTVVLIDGYALSDGSELRGVGTFLRRVIGGLGGRSDLDLKVLADPGARLPDGVAQIYLRQRAPRRLRSLEHDLLLPLSISRQHGGVFFSPAQHPPRRSAIPWVQTLHDLIPLTRPHPLLAADRRRWLRMGPRLRRAAAVATVSRFTADEAIRSLGLDPNRIHVIHNGVDHTVFRPREPGDLDAESPYLLHVAAWGPHKGFPEALAVVSAIAQAGLPHRLILAGPQDEWMRGQIQALVSASPACERVEIAGYVDDLPALYRGATAVLVTSRCEGFGFPALEAMACGTPVVAFDNSSLPEVIGDGGLIVPDGDVAAMAGAVRRLADSEQLRSELGERGVAQASRFRWEDAIGAYGELLKSVAR